MKLARYLERRVLHAVFLLAAISVLSFAASQLAPGSFLDELRVNPRVSAQTIESLRTQYALDQPAPIRYARWVKSFLHGNLGYSLSYNVEINSLIWERLRNTLLLGGTAMLVAWGLALPMGVCSGRFPGGWMDRLFTFSSTVLLGTPELALALFLILLAAHFGTLPTGGMSSAENQSGFAVSIDIIRHLVIPAAALALAAVPMLFRHVRAAVAEAYGATFVEAARGHGVSEGRLLFRHVLPVAANPLISLFGLSLAALVSGSFLVEVLCGWPGLGPLFLEATYNHDSLVVLAIVMLFSLFLIAGNLAADLLLYAADPRVRAE